MVVQTADLTHSNGLINEIVKGHGLVGIAHKLSLLISRPVLITNHLFHVLASSEEISSKQLQVEKLVEIELNDGGEHFFECLIQSDDLTLKAIGLHMIIDNQVNGYLFFEYFLPNKLEEQLLQQALLLCQIELQKQHEIKLVNQDYKDAFIFDLLYGNIKNEEDIIIRGNLWHVDFQRPHAVVVFSLKDFELYSSDPQLVDKISHIVELGLGQRQIKALTMSKRDEIIIIYPIKHNFIAKDRVCIKEFISWVYSQANKTGIENRVIPGIGRAYNNPTELFRSYQEAKVSRELGLIMNIEFPFFRDLGLVQILYNHDLQELKEYYKDTIGPLEKYDQTHESNLMETLEIYLRNQCDLSKSADTLFLHRNSLRYRLKKIEEILNIQLNDMDSTMNLMIAFKIKQIKKI